jgi:hypothetical protein
LGSLETFIIVLLGSGTGYPFSSFPTKSFIELFFLRSIVPFPYFPLAPLGAMQLCS